MGNRSSSSVRSAGPPPLLSAAVVGDAAKFRDFWMGNDSVDLNDAQDNNVLHALFSCRLENGRCSEILGFINESVPRSQLIKAHRARNKIGCTPLWILVAYGNVALLTEVLRDFEEKGQMDVFSELIEQSNNQGDSPFLATCSQGNTGMMRYLKEEIYTPSQFKAALTRKNKKGTTPLQITVANNHESLLEYMLLVGEVVVRKQLLECNSIGLSLFHICSERNAHEILQTILKFMDDDKSSSDRSDTFDKIISLKDKNGANPIHVAAFCGNVQVVEVWIDFVKKACSHVDNDSKKSKIVAYLDQLDGQGRTAYWLGVVQGRSRIGELLAGEGVDTENPKMVLEIEEAQEKRQKASAARQQENQTIDGSALLNR